MNDAFEELYSDKENCIPSIIQSQYIKNIYTKNFSNKIIITNLILKLSQ